MFMEMAGGGGASTLDWMRNNEDLHSAHGQTEVFNGSLNSH